MSLVHSSNIKFQTLAQSGRVILPSLLACNFANLERDIKELEEAGVQGLHLDIMDGHFVPNLSFGIPVVEAVRKITDLVLDVHLMLANPEEYFEVFKKAGADGITFHVESIADLESPGKNFARNGLAHSDSDSISNFIPHTISALQQIRKLGAASGLSLIPPTDVTVVEPFLSYCDNVLVMSVMPGFGGQEFDPSSKAKLAWLKNFASPEILRSIDGGVNQKTLEVCRDAGATGLVMGTAIFKNNQIKEQFCVLNATLHKERLQS